MMRHALIAAVTLLLGPACFAQNWELGAIGGMATDIGLKVKRDSASADAGFKPGAVMGLRAGESGDRLGGEVTYLMRRGAAQLKGGGKSAEFSAEQHLFTADFLWHFAPARQTMRPFFVAGGGARVVRGTGQERAFQELSNLAVLTRTTEVDPVAHVGFGVKVKFGRFGQFRAEFRDYLGFSSSEVIAPAPGARKTGFLNDLMGLIGVGFVF